MARLTDKTLAQSSAITNTTLIHIVTTGDTSQNSAGSSYKAELQQLTGIFSGLAFTGGTVNGPTVFTNGVTGSSISATTYQNLPVSGLTEGTGVSITGNNGNYTITVTGSTGTSGINGTSGIDGTSGINGISGTSGTSGINGTSGTSGINGTSGLNGTSGSSGTSGVGGVSINSFNNIGSTGSSFNWDVSGVSTNYQVTLTANTTLSLTNVRNGEYGTLIVIQDGVGGRTLSLGNVNGGSGTHRVVNGGGPVVLTSNAGATDIITFTYNGSTMYWTVGNDYI